MIARRSFIVGLASFIAAPAIVQAGNLMPVKQMLSDGVTLFSAEHPFNNYVIAADLTEDSIVEFTIELTKSFSPLYYRKYLKYNAITNQWG